MIPIHVILKRFITENLDNDEFVQSYLMVLWSRIVGEQVAKVASISNLKGTTLIVHVYDQEWLKVLSRMENEIKEKINSFLPKPLVEHIEFKKAKKAEKKAVSYDLSIDEKEGQQQNTPKEAEFISDTELKDLFKKAYLRRQKIKRNE